MPLATFCASNGFDEASAENACAALFAAGLEDEEEDNAEEPIEADC